MVTVTSKVLPYPKEPAETHAHRSGTAPALVALVLTRPPSFEQPAPALPPPEGIRTDGIEQPQPPAGVAYLPGEAVLLMTTAFPAMSRAQRLAAVSFAVEDRIGQPLEEVHVALGPEMPGSAGRWLVAVASHAVIAAHQPPPGIRLLPDTVAVPVPQSGWSVWAGTTRAIVRCDDGSGFAAPITALSVFWEAAGRPEITLHGGALPASFPVRAREPLGTGHIPDLAGFDLNGRHHAATDPAFRRTVRGLAAIIAFAAVGHLVLAWLDLLALGRLAEVRALTVRTVLAEQAQPVVGELDPAIAQAVAARRPLDRPSSLDLMNKIFSAMARETGRISVQDLRIDAVQRSAVLTLEAPDLATLQRVEAVLVEAGLTVTSGAATTGNGAAEVRLTIRDGAV
ncbi:MAG: type II secretion system protein GspL [Gemmobacter sp.]